MSYLIQLEENKLAELKDLKKTTKDSKILRRYQCIHMLDNGMTKKATAELLDVNIDTITDWVKLYNRSGLGGLSTLNYEGRRKSVLSFYFFQECFYYLCTTELTSVNKMVGSKLTGLIAPIMFSLLLPVLANTCFVPLLPLNCQA